MSVEDKISAYRRRKDARQKGNAYYNFKKRRAARKAEREDAKWITIGAVEPDERRGAPGMKGRHVLIDDEGKVLSGAGGSLTGVTLSGAESTSGDVKVDPAKTSDPLPTSPAGEEGKSSSEVAAEAKETGSKGTESEEPKKESEAGEETSGEEPKEPEEKSDEFSIHDFESAAHDKEKLKDWLENAPTATRLYYDVDGTEVVIEKDKFGTWHERFVGSFEDEGEFDDSDDLMGELETIFGLTSSFEIVDGKSGEKITASVGGEEPKKKFDFETAKKAIGSEDVEGWKKWLEDAPIGTGIIFEDGTGDEYYKGEDGWSQKGASFPSSGDDLLFSEEQLEKFIANGYGLNVVDPETGEVLELIPKGTGELEGTEKSSESLPPKIEEEPEKPYKAKDDLASAVTAFDEPTINKRLDEMDTGAVIIAETAYKTIRYTKQEDGSWKQESKYPWAGDDKWLGGYVKNNHDVALQMAMAKNVSVDGKEMNVPAIHLLNATLLKLKKGDGNVEKLKESIGLTNKDFAAVMKNMDGETVFITKQADGTFDVKEGDKTRKLSDTGLVNLIKNKDLWLKTRLSEQGWAASGQSMLKKHLAPLKKSVLTSPDYNAFHDTLTAIKSGSTFQMRNTDGSGYVVRKIGDVFTGDRGYVVKEIDKDGNIKDVEFYLGKEDTELHKKLSEAAKKGATFSADLDIGPYAPPEKKPAKKTYKGPADTSSHASEGKTSGGLSTVKFGEDAYSDAARKGAIQEPGTEEGKTKVHKELFPAMKEWWKGLSSSSKSSLRDYTGSYHDTNEPLRGYSYTSYTKDADHIRNKIKAIDDALEQTTMDKPIVLTRGISLGTFRAMVDHQSSSYSKWGPDSFGADLIGKEITEPSYMSCTAAGAADFSSKPVQLKIYCPTGTKGAYINPISSYGMELSDSAVETSSLKSPASGSEFEFLLQRGCKFKVRNIEKPGGKYKVELDLVEQNPRPMKVVGTKCVYDDGKDAYDF